MKINRTKALCLTVIFILLFLGGCGKSKTSLPPMETAKLGAMIGSTDETLAEHNYPKAELFRYNNYMDEAAALEANKIDYALMDYANAWNYERNNKKLTMLPQKLTDNISAIALNKNNKELNKKINEIVNRYLSDGTMDTIISHWFREDGSDYVIEDTAQITDEPLLHVAVTTLSEPRCFIRDGKITGLHVELFNRIAKELGMKVEYQDMTFSAMLDSLQSGKSDAIASIYDTPEREKRVDFTAGYLSNPVVVLVRTDRIKGTTKASKDTITSNDQLNNRRIGFITGMAHIDGFRTKYKAQEYEFNEFSSMLAALKADKIDAMLTGEGKVAQITKENPELTALPYYYKNYSSVGIQKDNTELANKLNPVIKRMMEDGSIDKLNKKWMGKDEDAKILTPVTLNGEHGTLVAGVLGDDYPYSYYKNNELVGIEVELARLFASELGMKLKLVTMDFSAIIPSIQSGKIDIAFYLSYTKEREKSIQFLTPMSSDYYVAIVKKAAGTDASSGNFLTAGMMDLRDSFHKTFVVEDRYKLILQGLWTTIVISMLSVLFGSLLGAFICFLHRSHLPLLSGMATVYIRLIQGVPIVLILMILYYILFAKVDIDPVIIAVVGFSINFAAYASEIFRIAIDAIDKGQLEAAYALGFSKHAGFFKVILPQALRHILPIYKGEFISMVKMTSVVGYIAIQDLTKMSDIIRSRTFDAFFPLFMTAFVYFVITYLFIFVLGKIERHIDPKRRKRVIKGIL